MFGEAEFYFLVLFLITWGPRLFCERKNIMGYNKNSENII